MKIIFGIVLGILWGSAGAGLDFLIMKMILKKKRESEMMGFNLLRGVVDVVVIGSIFLLRSANWVSFPTLLIAAAAVLSVLKIIFTYQLARPESTKGDTQS